MTIFYCLLESLGCVCVCELTNKKMFYRLGLGSGGIRNMGYTILHTSILECTETLLDYNRKPHLFYIGILKKSLV